MYLDAPGRPRVELVEFEGLVKVELVVVLAPLLG